MRPKGFRSRRPLLARLAAVLIVVVILMGLMSIITNRLGIERGLSVALFPMVILTMTIGGLEIFDEARLFDGGGGAGGLRGAGGAGARGTADGDVNESYRVRRRRL